jgi:A/G-specific adenine glycosylase
LESGCEWEADAQVQRRPAARFEDTNRWVRGRVIAALAAGGQLPAIDPARLEHALDGLVRDGLVQRDGAVVRLG